VVVAIEQGNEHIRAIGEFIYAFSQLDFTIRVRCLSIFGPQAVTLELMLMLEHVDTAKLLAGYMRVRVERSLKEEHRKLLDDIVGDYYRINEDRVRIVHGIWTPSEEGLALMRGSSGKKPAEYPWHFEDVEKLNELTRMCNELNGRFISAP
jgi:hypothetical protein